LTLEYSLALANFRKLVSEFEPILDEANEAQTRFTFIDRLLTECLGWPSSEVRVEVYEEGDRSDYECGIPRKMIVEAKRASIGFEFPPRGLTSNLKIGIRSILSFNEKVEHDLKQVHKYCQDRGVRIAVLSNGRQLIAFLAWLDGMPPLSGDALVFDSFATMDKNFAKLFECLSPDGIVEQRLERLLNPQKAAMLPAKLSTHCLDYVKYKYSSEFQENLRNSSSLVIEDLGRTTALEEEFLRECYCESGPLSQYSLLSKNILSSRYASLFSDTQTGSRTEEINPKRNSAKLSDRVMAEAMSRRPIVLLGDVGVGKTSFIKNLIHISAPEQIGKSIFVYFDLGSQGALSLSTKDALFNSMEKTLREQCGVNIWDEGLIQEIYKQQLSEFDNGYIGMLKDSQPNIYAQERLTRLKELTSDRGNHLKGCLEVSATKQRAQLLIVIDNADQRPFEVQQEAFLMANELAATWHALVFIALRPQTFHASKRSGTISAYPPKVFVIAPPKLEDAIEKRLSFARKMAEGKLPIAQIKGLSMHVDSLAIVLRVLQKSLVENKELYEFIVNVSGGNVRVAVELISKFLGNPNVESERIVQIESEGGRYIVPLHEFAKGGLLGDYAHYQEESSYAFNVYNIYFPDKREHFLTQLILGYLASDVSNVTKLNGFGAKNPILIEMQDLGFSVEQTEKHLRRLVKHRLLETEERNLLEDDYTEISLPNSFRITSLGQYHLKRWSYEFSFVEAMSFDTPILDEGVRSNLVKRVNGSSLTDRYDRAEGFMNYLASCWTDSLARPYFDWTQAKIVEHISFDRVRNKLGKPTTSLNSA